MRISGINDECLDPMLSIFVLLFSLYYIQGVTEFHIPKQGKNVHIDMCQETLNLWITAEYSITFIISVKKFLYEIQCTFHERQEFREQLSNYQLFQKYPVPWGSLVRLFRYNSAQSKTPTCKENKLK
jgi:hypothetical protein